MGRCVGRCLLALAGICGTAIFLTCRHLFVNEEAEHRLDGVLLQAENARLQQQITTLTDEKTTLQRQMRGLQRRLKDPLWVLSGYGDNCDEACSSVGLVCEKGLMEAVKSEEKVTLAAASTGTNCTKIHSHPGLSGDWDGPWMDENNGCGYSSSNSWSTTCAMKIITNFRRICACQVPLLADVVKEGHHCDVHKNAVKDLSHAHSLQACIRKVSDDRDCGKYFTFCADYNGLCKCASKSGSNPLAKVAEPWVACSIYKLRQEPRDLAFTCKQLLNTVCGPKTTVGELGPEQSYVSAVGGPTATGKFLVTSFHVGTSNEMAWLGEHLGIQMNIGGFGAHTEVGEDGTCDPLRFSNARVATIWEDAELARRLESYKGIISTDTSHAIYPFLKNERFHSKPLILWITNRYDYCGVRDPVLDENDLFDFLNAMEEAACCKENVYFVAAHDSEIEYAHVKFPKMNTSRWRTIYPIGHQSSWLKDVMAKEVPDTVRDAKPFQSDKLCIFPAFNEAGIVKEYQEKLQTRGIAFQDLNMRKYGGPRGLSIMCKAVLHVPYSPNTMALWENVQIGNVFFLPTPELAMKLMRDRRSNYFQMSGGLDLQRELTEDFLRRTEWWREDRRPLFEYFDSPEDLAHKFLHTDFAEKRRRMRKYMDDHEQAQLAKWRALFAEVQSSFL